jgi:hypothetical protein
MPPHRRRRFTAFAGIDGRSQPAPLAFARKGSRQGNATIADQWVRLGMALTIIALVSIGLYRVNVRTGMGEPAVVGFTDRR